MNASTNTTNTTNTTDHINWQKIYEDAFWDAMGHGMCEGDAEQYANKKSAEMMTLFSKARRANQG